MTAEQVMARVVEWGAKMQADPVAHLQTLVPREEFIRKILEICETDDNRAKWTRLLNALLEKRAELLLRIRQGKARGLKESEYMLSELPPPQKQEGNTAAPARRARRRSRGEAAPVCDNGDSIAQSVVRRHRAK